MSDPIPPLRTLLWRGMRRRCPQCGQGLLFKHWSKLKLNSYCDVCGLRYLENQGDLWGFLLLADRVLFIIPLIVMFFLIPRDPHSVGTYLLGGGLLVVLICTFPHRIGMSLAFDYMIRRKSGDLSDQNSEMDK
jgi:uncharacterized protein (DUF983 family)